MPIPVVVVSGRVSPPGWTATKPAENSSNGLAVPGPVANAPVALRRSARPVEPPAPGMTSWCGGDEHRQVSTLPRVVATPARRPPFRPQGYTAVSSQPGDASPDVPVREAATIWEESSPPQRLMKARQLNFAPITPCVTFTIQGECWPSSTSRAASLADPIERAPESPASDLDRGRHAGRTVERPQHG